MGSMFVSIFLCVGGGLCVFFSVYFCVCLAQTGRIRVCLYPSFCWLVGVMCVYLSVRIYVCLAHTGRISKSSYASMSACDLIRVCMFV